MRLISGNFKCRKEKSLHKYAATFGTAQFYLLVRRIVARSLVFLHTQFKIDCFGPSLAGGGGFIIIFFLFWTHQLLSEVGFRLGLPLPLELTWPINLAS